MTTYVSLFPSDLLLHISKDKQRKLGIPNWQDMKWKKLETGVMNVLIGKSCWRKKRSSIDFDYGCPITQFKNFFYWRYEFILPGFLHFSILSNRYTFIKCVALKKPIQYGNNVCKRTLLDAVSYTHLDVYKRQQLYI